MKKGFLVILEFEDPVNEDYPVTKYFNWRSKKRLAAWLDCLGIEYFDISEVILEGDFNFL